MVWWGMGVGGVQVIEPHEEIVDDRGYHHALDDLGRIRYKHIIVWEKYHQRRLPKGHVIHHKDGDRGNNRIENLELMMNGEHSKLHHWKFGKYLNSILLEADMP